MSSYIILYCSILGYYIILYLTLWASQVPGAGRLVQAGQAREERDDSNDKNSNDTTHNSHNHNTNTTNDKGQEVKENRRLTAEASFEGISPRSDVQTSAGRISVPC